MFWLPKDYEGLRHSVYLVGEYSQPEGIKGRRGLLCRVGQMKLEMRLNERLDGSTNDLLA